MKKVPKPPQNLTVTLPDGSVVGVNDQLDGIPSAYVRPNYNDGGVPPVVHQPFPQHFKNFNVPQSADAFNALIQNQSPNVIWEKAAICPNRNLDRAHDPNCRMCSDGIIFYERQIVPMLIQNVALQQQYFIQGRFASGAVTVTSMAMNPISYGDRITVMSSVIRNTELRMRRDSDLIDPLKYMAIEVSLVRSVSRTFDCNLDFTINDDGFIEWSADEARRPAVGEFFSVVYTHYPVYIVTEMVHHHRDRRVKAGTLQDQTIHLPVQAIAKLDFLVRDESRDAPEKTEHKSPFDDQ